MHSSPMRRNVMGDARPTRGRSLGCALVITAGLLAGCASQVGTSPYPSLQPIDTLLAEAEVSATDPGPAQVQRAANLRNRVARAAP